jgi:EGF-like domain
MKVIVFVSYLFGLINYVSADCSNLNNCNGHGKCNVETSACECYDGFGSATDITYYKAPDCSARTCPSWKSWGDVPTSPTTAHKVVECSNRGSCDRVTGVCNCLAGFTGAACQRSACPNDCSGHGQCVSMAQMAQMSNALPLGPNTFYEGDEVSSHILIGCLSLIRVPFAGPRSR